MIRAVLVVGIVLSVVVLVRGPRGVRHQALRRLALLAFAAGALLSLVYPDSWTWAARRLDVGRGADLLLYLTIVTFLGFVATSYVRFQEMQQQITRLSRRVALDTAPPPPPRPELAPRPELLARPDPARPEPAAPHAGAVGERSAQDRERAAGPHPRG